MGTANRAIPQMARVRRLEAAGFRAWPASEVVYDGTWLIRLTAGDGAKRLNSINPLDPADTAAFPERIACAARRFAAYERPLTFRLSPLAGAAIEAYLDVQGWKPFSESIVMSLDIGRLAFDDVIHQIPLRDVTRFVEAAMEVQGSDPALRPGFAEVIRRIEPEVGLFVTSDGSQPEAAAICVHDGDLAGLFEIGTSERARRKGHGRRIVLSTLKWARSRGARKAWLQVEADNEAAIGLYRSIGFAEVYRYHYRRPPGA